MVRKIGLFWQFPQISRPVLAPAGTYTKSGPGPRALSLLCPVGSSPSFITVYSQDSVPTEQRSRAVQRTVQQRAVQSSRAGVDSVSGFASGRYHATLCFTWPCYATHRVDGLPYHVKASGGCPHQCQPQANPCPRQSITCLKHWKCRSIIKLFFEDPVCAFSFSL